MQSSCARGPQQSNLPGSEGSVLIFFSAAADSTSTLLTRAYNDCIVLGLGTNLLLSEALAQPLSSLRGKEVIC